MTRTIFFVDRERQNPSSHREFQQGVGIWIELEASLNLQVRLSILVRTFGKLMSAISRLHLRRVQPRTPIQSCVGL